MQSNANTLKTMRLILPLFLFGMLVTSCIDNNYDLSEIDTDGGVIGEDKPSHELFSHPESPRLVTFLNKVL